MTKEERLYNIIQQGVELLKEYHKQISIVRKANTLGCTFDNSTLANMIAAGTPTCCPCSAWQKPLPRS